jgi:hypothetical protein
MSFWRRYWHSLDRLLQRREVLAQKIREWQRRRQRRRIPAMDELEGRTLPNSVSWMAGTSGFWDVGSNWSTGTVPGANDDVVINQAAALTVTLRGGGFTVHSLQSTNDIALTAGSLTIGAASELDGSFSLSNGTFTTNATLVAKGASSWTSGTINGTGTFTNQGTLTLSGGDKTLNGQLESAGTIQDQGDGNRLFITSSATFTNDAGALFDFVGNQNAAVLDANQFNGKQSTFVNAGTVRTSAGTGTAFIGTAIFNNKGGTVEADAATLSLGAGAVLSTTATFSAASGAVLDMTGNQNTTYTGSFSGSGAGTVQINGGTLAVGTAGASFQFSGSLLQWTGGTISGPGTLTNQGTLTIGANDKTLNGTLQNTGTVKDIGNGNRFFITSSGTFMNQAGAIFDFIGPGGAGIFDSNQFNGKQSKFINAGTLRTSAGTGTAFVGPVIFDNEGGTVEADAATLALGAGAVMSSTATFTAAAGAVLDLTGNQNSNYTGSFSGTGAGMVLLKGGTLGVGAAGATFQFGGSLLQWTGGTISGPGTLLNQGTLTIGGGDKSLNLPFENAGTIKDNGDGNRLFITSSGTLTNDAGALVDFIGPNNAYIYDSNQFNGKQSTIVNAGTFRASLGTATLDIDQVESMGGTITAAAGGVLDLTGGGTETYTGVFSGSGAGTIQLSSGTLLVGAAGASFQFSGSLFQWTGGTIAGPAALKNLGTMTLAGGDKTLSGAFENAGTIEDVGNGNRLFINSSAVFTNDAGALFDFVGPGDARISDANQFNGKQSTFINSGKVRISQGTGTAFIGPALFDDEGGTVEADVTNLTLNCNNVIGNNAVLTAAAGAVFDLTGGANTTYTGSFSGSGSGTVQLASGT